MNTIIKKLKVIYNTIDNKQYAHIVRGKKYPLNPGDWIIHIGNKQIFQYTKGSNEYWRKIIASTYDLYTDEFSGVIDESNGVHEIQKKRILCIHPKYLKNNPNKVSVIFQNYSNCLNFQTEICKNVCNECLNNCSKKDIIIDIKK